MTCATASRVSPAGSGSSPARTSRRTRAACRDRPRCDRLAPAWCRPWLVSPLDRHQTPRNAVLFVIESGCCDFLGARASCPPGPKARNGRPVEGAKLLKRARCLLAGCFSGRQEKPQVSLNALINIMLSTLFLSRRYAAPQRKSRKPKSRKIHDTSRKNAPPFACAPPSSEPSMSPAGTGTGMAGTA